MRISDILRSKKNRDENAYPSRDNLKNFGVQTPKNPSTSPAQDLTLIKRSFPESQKILQNRAEPSKPSVVYNQQTSRAFASQAKVIYGNLIQKARNLLSGFSKSPVELPDLEEICEGIERTMEISETYPARILELVERSTPDDYLPGHIVNVTVLSVALCQQLNWPKETLRAVGVGALLHDAGMVFHRPTYSKSQALTNEERQAIRKLPQECIAILENFLKALSPESKKTVENVILQFQERISGEGYPNRLTGDQICKEAQVVGLCDTYEAITHPRPYRDRKLPHEALRYLIELSGSLFDGNLIKMLWETLSLFPPGSFVKLNTGEVAKIIDLNKKLPTRPIAQVIVTSSGERMKMEKIIDLSQTPGIVIQKAVDECSLDTTDRRLSLELRAQRWWIK